MVQRAQSRLLREEGALEELEEEVLEAELHGTEVSAY